MIFVKRIGLFSLLLGALAVPAAFAAVYARTSHIPGSGLILLWMDNMGLVNQSNNGVASLSEASIFAINDQNGITLHFAIAILLAIASMGCALVAEFRREPTLYLSCGYACGALALWLVKPTVGFVLFMAGVIVVLAHRNHRDT